MQGKNDGTVKAVLDKLRVNRKGEVMSTDPMLLESSVNQAAKLARGALKIDMDPKKRLALKAALRYLKKAGAREGSLRMERDRFSQSAQTAIDRILRESSIPPGPDMLDAMLLNWNCKTV